MFLPFPLMYLAFFPAAKSAAGNTFLFALILGVVVLTGLYLWIFHLCSRIQFAYFDILVNRGQFVAPAWRKYGPQSLSWTGVKVLLGTLAMALSAIPMLAFVRRVMPLFLSLRNFQPGQPPNMKIIGAFYAGYGLLLIVLGSLYLLSSLLTDFILPSLALEDTGIAEGFRRMAALIRNEPGQFALYTLLKVVLGLTAYMAAIIAWEIVFILASFLLALVVLAIGFVLHAVGVPTAILTVLGFTIAAAWYLFAVVYSMMLAIGPVLTFSDAYALYFLAGRYPLLAELLERSTPPPANVYPNPYPPYPPADLPPTAPPPALG